MVLTNTAVHQPDSSKGPVLIRLAHQPLLNRIACRWTPLFVRTTTSLTWPRLPRDVRNAFAAPYDTPARRLRVSEFVADIPFAAGHPSRPTLDRIADGITDLDVPALLLWGPRDPVFLEEHLRDLQQRLPQADLHRYEKASHLLPEDAPGYAAAVGHAGCRSWTCPRTAPGDRHRSSRPPAVPCCTELAAPPDDDTAAVVEVGGRSISWAELPPGSGTPRPAWPRPASSQATGSRCWCRRRSN